MAGSFSYRFIRRVLLGVTVFLILPLVIAVCLNDIRLNQFMIQRDAIAAGRWQSETITDFIVSAYSRGLNALFHRRELSADEVNPDDAKQVFAYVFERIPSYSIVYPTETYFYYTFRLPQVEVAGNLRFVDADKGVLYMGYFNRTDPHSSFGGAMALRAADGVQVTMPEPYVVHVTYRGTTRRFKLNPTAPVQTAIPTLLPSERFVSRITDESGFRFILIANTVTGGLYYLLDESLDGVADVLVPGPPGYLLGRKSGYVFFRDESYARTLLVGVHEKHVYFNDYFDGPFDQVPPRLPIREILHAAYPYTHLRGGIDEHGNFRTIPDTRVAISPYTSYRKLAALIEYQRRCFERSDGVRDELWSCLTYEWKRDFHRSVERMDMEAEDGATSHWIPRSQGWPPNHWGDRSMEWDPEHKVSGSSAWPANHLIGQSYGGTVPAPWRLP